MIGTTVGKYRILERLGRGGMGTVYKALDDTLDREVAIKVLNPDLADTDLLKRFRTEAITLARLNHPGIATIYELYRHDDELLMVMEFVRGETVAQLSERLGPLAPPQAAHICIQVLDALGYAHRAGVVHRDLKPANLMVTDAGAVKVMDFGIARVLGTEHFTQGGYMMGTPAYMAPEQVLGREVDGRSDLYSVAVVLYKLLSGQLPFSAETTMAMVQKQIADPPTPIGQFRPDLPSWCANVIDRALSKAPALRFQRAEEFKAMLATAVMPATLGELPTLATPTPPGLDIGATLGLALDKSTIVLSPSSGPARPEPVGASPGLDAPSTAGATIDRHTTTVVLQRHHLLALVGVLGILFVGIAILAYAAFQSSGSASPPTSIAGEPAIASTSVPRTGDVPAAPAQSDGESASGEDLSAPGGGSGTDRGGDGRTRDVAATFGSQIAAPPTQQFDARRSSSPASPPTSPPALERGKSPARGSPSEAANRDASPVSFDAVRVVVNDGGKLREREGILRLGEGRVTLLDGKAKAPIASVTYAEITGAFYSRSKQPKWKDAHGREVVSDVDLGPLGFLRSERNWLILTTEAHSLLIRFEDPALRTILPEVQERTGKTIKR